MKLITIFALLAMCLSASGQNLIIPGQTPARPHKMIGERNTIYYDPSNPPQVFKGGVGYVEDRILLSRNTDTVLASGYASIATGTGDLNMTTNRNFLNKNNSQRIRQNGTLTNVSFYVDREQAIQVFVHVWRKNGIVYDRVGSESIIPPAGIGVKNIKLLHPFAVQEGDYVGIGYDGTAGKFKSVSGYADGSLAYSDTKVPGNSYNWDTVSTLAAILPIKTYQQAPMVVGIGNSIMAGHPAHYSFIEASFTNVKANQILYQLQVIDTNYIYQNMGIGSQKTTSIKNRFMADVVALKPKIALIEGGVNDIAGGSITRATFLSNYKFMLDSSIKYDIVPVVMKITPWTNGSNANLQKRDDWCEGLDSLVSLYSTAIYVDSDTTVGKFRTGGDVGNLWDIKTEYDADGVHFNLDGYAALARKIDIEIKKRYRFK